jgi:TPR repeat protein
MHSPVSTWIALGPLALSMFACKPGGVAEGIRVEAPNASQALGEAPVCTAVPDVAQPLVIDLSAAQRADLEIAMQSGRAVVHYGCDGLRVLTACELAGDYRFAGVGLKEEVIQLKSQDEVRASLPVSGVTLAAGLGRGTSLDLAIAMVGRGTALAGHASKAELKAQHEGSCEGATHFVRAAYVGAFAMQRGSGADVSAAASIFGVSTGAQSKSDKQTDLRDGSLEACRAASPDADAPPAQCRSSIRVDLLPLGDAPAAGGLAAIANPCPSGYAFAEGKCTPAAQAEAFQCDPGDEATCRTQCDAGSLGSCFNLAHVLTDQARLCAGGSESCVAVAMASPSQPEYARYAEGADLYTRACEGDIAAACYQVGSYFAEGAFGRAKSDEKADAAFDRGCAGGHAWSCSKLAERVEARDRTAARALALNERACDLGSKPGCFRTIAKYLKGEGTAKNPSAARAILERTCDAGESKRCAELGLYMLEGVLGPAARKDTADALGYIAKGCELDHGDACRLAAVAYAGQWGVKRDAGKAQAFFERGCAGEAAAGSECTQLAARLKGK